jgi:hypothetical protein
MKIARLLLLICTAISLYSLPAQIIIVRHAEKDPITRGLTQTGQERAAALAYYLTETNYLLNFGVPDVIFASRSVPISDRLVPRTIETMMPVAELLEMPIHTPFNGYQVNEMANLVLNNSKYDGKNILICWNHSSIHDLVNALQYQVPFDCSSTQNKYPDCRFDLAFVLTYPPPPPPPSQSRPYATVFFQQLMYGDITCATIPPYPPPLPPGACSCNDPASCSIICDIPCAKVGLGDD